MSTRIQKILNKMSKMRLGPEWSEFWQETYNNAPLRVKKHFLLEQFLWSILTPKERQQERNTLEATLTEKEWSYIIWKVCGINVARIAYNKRMKKHHPEYDVMKYEPHKTKKSRS